MQYILQFNITGIGPSRSQNLQIRFRTSPARDPHSAHNPLLLTINSSSSISFHPSRQNREPNFNPLKLSHNLHIFVAYPIHS